MRPTDSIRLPRAGTMVWSTPVSAFTEASASPSHCASDSTRVSITFCRCLVTLSTFLLSDIFNGEYLTIMFSFLHLCLSSTPYFLFGMCLRFDFPLNSSGSRLKPAFTVSASWRGGARKVLDNFG